MRAQVYRLLKILGREALDREEKIFVCIDGIDHAARAKNVVSFLDSLYLPEEIPDGICVSLFKVVGGNMFFYLCNSQIAPSEIWREGFKCVPDHTSPYCWRDENGNIVLRFERIASPIREAMHEKYYRQPILFRWLCNSEWLKETLCKHNLHLRYVSRLESIP